MTFTVERVSATSVRASDRPKVVVPMHPANSDYARILAAGVTIPEWAEPPTPPRTEGSFREFMALFTEAEADAIYAAEASTAANGDFTLRKWFDRARGGATMRLNHPDTIAGIGLLVAAGLLTQARADAVLGSDFNDQ